MKDIDYRNQLDAAKHDPKLLKSALVKLLKNPGDQGYLTKWVNGEDRRKEIVEYYLTLCEGNKFPLDLRGIDLSKITLCDANWPNGVDLRGAKLRNSDLHLWGTVDFDLSGADLRNADLTGSAMVGTKWDGAIVIGTPRFNLVHAMQPHGTLRFEDCIATEEDLLTAIGGMLKLSDDQITPLHVMQMPNLYHVAMDCAKNEALDTTLKDNLDNAARDLRKRFPCFVDETPKYALSPRENWELQAFRQVLRLDKNFANLPHDIHVEIASHLLADKQLPLEDVRAIAKVFVADAGNNEKRVVPRKDFVEALLNESERGIFARAENSGISLL